MPAAAVAALPVAVPVAATASPSAPAPATGPAGCPHCGAAITLGDAFCGECGQRL
jgi:hypothetical protein